MIPLILNLELKQSNFSMDNTSTYILGGKGYDCEKPLDKGVFKTMLSVCPQYTGQFLLLPLMIRLILNLELKRSNFSMDNTSTYI